MKRYSVKGTPEGFQVNEDDNGDFIAADDVNALMQRYTEDRDALADAITSQREEIAALKAGKSYKEQLEIVSSPDRSPIEVWGSLAFADLPQDTKNEIYMAYAKGVVDNDAGHPPRFVTKDTDTGETSVDELARDDIAEDIAEKEDKKVLDNIKDDIPDELKDVFGDAVAVEEEK